MNFNAIKSRAKNIITQPGPEWEKIQNEAASKNVIIINYALPLILLGTASMFIGNSLFNPGHSIAYGFASAVAYFISMAAGIFVSAIVVNELAPNFGSEKNIEAAYKLVIYSFTASFVASIVANLHHGLSIIGLFSLYSFYLLWTGVSLLMKTPEDKKVGYVVVSVLVIILVYFLISLILSSILLASYVTYTIV